MKNRTTELNVESADRSPDAKLSKNEAATRRRRPRGREGQNPRQRHRHDAASASRRPPSSTAGTARTGTASRCWGKTAEAARDIKAGDTIAINGSLRHRTVGDDGQERKLSAIDCRQFQVLERSQQKGKDISREPDRAAAPDAGDKPRTRPRSRSKGVDRDM